MHNVEKNCSKRHLQMDSQQWCQPGIREDMLGVRKIKNNNKYETSSIILLTDQNHIN